MNTSPMRVFLIFVVYSVESNKFQRFSSIFHGLTNLIWLLRYPQISRNDEKTSGMPISERHPGTHATGEVQQSTEYAHTKKICKVVTGSIPAWSHLSPLSSRRPVMRRNLGLKFETMSSFGDSYACNRNNSTTPLTGTYIRWMFEAIGRCETRLDA